MKVTFLNLSKYFPPSRNSSISGDFQVREDEMDEVQPALDKLAESLRAAIGKEKTKADW